MTYLKQIVKYKHFIAISIAAIAIASYVLPVTQIFPFAKASSSVHQTSSQACVTGRYGGNCQNLNSQNAGNDIVSNVIGVQSGSNPTPTSLDSVSPTTPRPLTENSQEATLTPSTTTSEPSNTNEADGGHSTDPTQEKDTHSTTNTNSGEKDTHSTTNTNSGEK